ncbi:MAG: glycosyltransferase family 25 protein [Alphaproteobacteria bacterium]
MSFPRVFVINMPRDVDRKTAMVSRLDAIGIVPEFIEGVDGATLDLEQSPFYDGAHRRRCYGRDMTAGELGCLLAHRKIFEKMVDEGMAHAIVLEDDVMFEDDFPAVVRALIDDPRPWDVIRFLGAGKIYDRGCRIIAPLLGRYALARLPTAPGGAHAYLMTLKAARVMVAHTRVNWVPIDTLQGRCWETGLETLVVHPAPLGTDPAAGSTIGDVRFDKTVRSTGWARRLYPLTRFWFKLCEGLGKRFVFLSAWFRDQKTYRP